jgi:hypothetical protein
MGLDFSHGGASWAYGGFARFREALATHEGFNLREMDGFGPLGRTDWIGKPWDTITTDLRPLLEHSDCDGELTPAECRQVAPRLREVIDALWPDEHDYDRRAGLALVHGMGLAAQADEPLQFR